MVRGWRGGFSRGLRVCLVAAGNAVGSALRAALGGLHGGLYCGLRGQAAYFVLQECGATVAYGRFTAGCFDNVAGLASCLGLSLPVGMEWLRGGCKLRQVAVVAGKGLCVVALFLSGSRTGMLCMAVWAVAELPCGRRAKVVAGAIVVAAGLVLTLMVKTDSSRGRLFIAQRTTELVAENPIIGHGPGGFRTRYMDVQAEWLGRHADSPCATLAEQADFFALVNFK